MISLRPLMAKCTKSLWINDVSAELIKHGDVAVVEKVLNIIMYSIIFTWVCRWCVVSWMWRWFALCRRWGCR